MERSRGYIEQDRWSGGAGREAFVSQRSGSVRIATVGGSGADG
jgi:hypothetical protein